MSELDPQIADMIGVLDAGFPAVHTMTGHQARAVIRSRFKPADAPGPVASVQDTTVTGPAGPVAVRIYRPTTTNDAVPTLVYAHGGGWVFCDLDSHDELCRDFANRIPAGIQPGGSHASTSRPKPIAQAASTAT